MPWLEPEVEEPLRLQRHNSGLRREDVGIGHRANQPNLDQVVELSPAEIGALEKVLAVERLSLLLQAGGATAIRHPGALLPSLPQCELGLDHLEREKVVALLAKDETETRHISVSELSVTAVRAVGVDQTLALQESDLGHGHVGEVVAKEIYHLADAVRLPLSHRRGRPGSGNGPPGPRHPDAARRCRLSVR